MKRTMIKVSPSVLVVIAAILILSTALGCKPAPDDSADDREYMDEFGRCATYEDQEDRDDCFVRLVEEFGKKEDCMQIADQEKRMDCLES
ncbi:hypothetical protein GF351_03285 [Candidatus Woesearchaeota archaeon]|nr:hypothetical protein [Candidatus Woesearchaeota archaeon]